MAKLSATAQTAGFSRLSTQFVRKSTSPSGMSGQLPVQRLCSCVGDPLRIVHKTTWKWTFSRQNRRKVTIVDMISIAPEGEGRGASSARRKLFAEAGRSRPSKTCFDVESVAKSEPVGIQNLCEP